MTDSTTILFASAAEGNASRMNNFLADRGYHPKTVTTLIGLDDAIDERVVDLVLIDADGFPPAIWKRCERLQQLEIPFFVISQHRAAIRSKGREYSATRVFEKPLGQDALVQTIQQLLQDA